MLSKVLSKALSKAEKSSAMLSVIFSNAQQCSAMLKNAVKQLIGLEGPLEDKSGF